MTRVFRYAGQSSARRMSRRRGSSRETRPDKGTVIDAPVVEATVTEAPMIGTPVIDAPLVEAPMVEASVTGSPVVDALVVEATVTEAPVIETSVTDAPLVEAPVTEAPVIDTSVAEAPVIAHSVIPSSVSDEDLIFAMDIGTRSVIGMVGYKKDDMLEIVAVAVEEHQSRAVVDGQIQDIRETARVAGRVKRGLEERTGRSLSQVYIAAAGRVLRTGTAEYEAEPPRDQSISGSFVAKMEFAAIRKVYEDLRGSEREENHSFLCVGHSIVRYTLDGYEFSTLVGHRGSKASVRVIATFLPKEVVDSLNSAMERIGLSVAGLTLEPIAAMNAVIPAELRRLNLALVDIGAGTTDIAICDNGSVSAYTMSTVAGDEITESIMDAFLTDFMTAEEIKKNLGEDRQIKFKNILGYETEITTGEIFNQIKPSVERMTGEILGRISQANAKPIAALFLVGGSSQIPGLAGMAADGLGVAENRVVIGGAQNMRKQVSSSLDIFGPEFATPLGIAITASHRERDESFAFTINNERFPMIGVWDMTVLDALQLAGYKYSQIMGRAGRSLIYELNGVRRGKRGGLQSPAYITRNDEPCALGDIIRAGDHIIFAPAIAGEDASLRLKDAVPAERPARVWINGVSYTAGHTFIVNGKPAAEDQYIHNMDVIYHTPVRTIADLRRDLRINDALYTIYVNGEEAPPDQALKNGDVIETKAREGKPVEGGVAIGAAEAELSGVNSLNDDGGSLNVDSGSSDDDSDWLSKNSGSPGVDSDSPDVDSYWLNDDNEAIHEDYAVDADMIVSDAPVGILPDGTLPGGVLPGGESPAVGGAPLVVYLNKKEIILPPKEHNEPRYFMDVFALVDIDIRDPKGDLTQTVNGAPASYMMELSEGDEIFIHWSQEPPL